MTKQKSQSKHKTPKTYDFETPLDPFQGESLKGIAAFIQSSLTLQHEPHDVGNLQSPEIRLPNELYQNIQQISKRVSSTPNTTPPSVTSILVTDVPNTQGDNQPYLRDPDPQGGQTIKVISSILDTPVLNTSHLLVTSKLVTELSSTEDKPRHIDSYKIDNIIDNRVSSIPDTDLSSNLDLPVTSTLDKGRLTTQAHSQSHLINACIPSTPSTHTASKPKDEEAAILSTPNTDSAASVSVESASNQTGEFTSTQDTTDASVLSSVFNTPLTPTRALTLGVDATSGLTRVIPLKVRVVVRGQDGLNKGEQKIYTFLWRAVYRPKEVERGDFRVVDRTIEISLRHIAKRADLGLANCAWHVRGLEEKGCIVRVRESDHYRPAVYRIREFTEIIEWRRDHGLTHFIQRGHLAVFVDPKSGVPLTRFRGQTGTIYRGQVIIGTPNIVMEGADNTGIICTPNMPATILNSNTPGVPNSRTDAVFNSNTASLNEKERHKRRDKSTSSFSYPSLPADLIQGLLLLLPTFDNEAASSLWNECRARAIDCTVEEVLHFSRAKATTFKTGKIQNPTGFLLVTVPKCFEGEAFRSFREQQQRWREEQQRREEEEKKKAQLVEEQVHIEEETYRQAEERLASLSAEERQALYQQKRTELLPHARSWNLEALEQSIRARMIRELQKEFLPKRESLP